MKKRLVIANWKMNPDSKEEAQSLWRATEEAALGLKKTDVVVCLPYPYLSLVSGGKKSPFIGAQDVAFSSHPSQTGEVSIEMLRDLGVRFVIVGHSERRALGETNELVRDKIEYVLKAGATPVLCVGERTRDPDGFYLKEISTQLEVALSGVSKKDILQVLIAYEPIWAIGKGAAPASPQDALEILLYIRRSLVKQFGKEAAKVALLYGGSVDSKNAAEFIQYSSVDGLLVGRESLKSKQFAELLSSVDNVA